MVSPILGQTLPVLNFPYYLTKPWTEPFRLCKWQKNLHMRKHLHKSRDKNNEEKIKGKDGTVAISGLNHRTDEPSMGDKVTETNRIFKSFVTGRDLSFVDKSRIGSSMLNSSGLHLNQKGSEALAKNTLNHISNCYWFKEVNSFCLNVNQIVMRYDLCLETKGLQNCEYTLMLQVSRCILKSFD